MENHYCNYSFPVVKGIVKKCDPQLQFCFLQFLQTEIIFNIAQLAAKYKIEGYFYNLVTVLIYFRKYLNRVDRSLYYLFYEEPEFKPLQQTYIINIAKSHGNIFFLLQNNYTKLFQQFESQAICVQEKQDLQIILQTAFFETDYPLPPCKRQTIGVYCQTPFQIFLSMIKFPSISSSEQYLEPALEKIKDFFCQSESIQKAVKIINQNTINNLKKMKILRYCPFQLIAINSDEMFIQNFQLHNILVILFKLVANNAQSSYIIVKQHKDPIMKMAEFVTRANIYKNIILDLEDKFGFMLESYGDIFQVITKGQHSPNLPKFSFWNGAIAIWIQQFKQTNQQLNESFNYILLKQRQKNAINFLDQKSISFPSIYNSVKLQLEQNSLVQEKRKQIYQEIGYSYEEFFEQNIDSYEILAKDYLENQIDTSINEINVHRIGYSEHSIKRIPFIKDFIESIKSSTTQFYWHLKKIIFKKNNDKKMQIGILKDLIKFDLNFIDNKFTKPFILKEIVNQAHLMIEDLVCKLPQFAVFTEEVIEKFAIYFDFSHKDNILDYFCTKSQIPNDCSQELRCFYDTYKNKSIEEMLNLVDSPKLEKDSIDSQIDEESSESLSSSSLISAEEQ